MLVKTNISFMDQTYVYLYENEGNVDLCKVDVMLSDGSLLPNTVQLNLTYPGNASLHTVSSAQNEVK